MAEEIFGWTAEDSAAARAEGWDVFTRTDRPPRWEIQRYDEAGVFADDDEALAHVEARASGGSRLHARALIAHVDGAR